MQGKTTHMTDGSAFYVPDGAFDAAAARQAYYAMMRRLNYPIPKVLETDSFWVCDFLHGDFARLGMGGIFWVNEQNVYGQAGGQQYQGEFKAGKYGYLGHEIYLLPGQMLPEHRHLGGSAGHGPKMEAWHVRYGTVTFFCEYAGTQGERPVSELPAAERPVGFGEPWCRARYYVRRQAGEIYRLDDPEAWHCQRADGAGAIVTEYATYHNHVTFSKPGMEFQCTAAAGNGSRNARGADNSAKGSKGS
jgi:hypothetical protein